MDLVNRAQEFSLKARKRIEHQRKYSNLPSSARLASVTKSGPSVADNPTTIAGKLHRAIARPRDSETISITLLDH